MLTTPPVIEVRTPVLVIVAIPVLALAQVYVKGPVPVAFVTSVTVPPEHTFAAPVILPATGALTVMVSAAEVAEQPLASVTV